MLIVIALGGNALLKRGEPQEASLQQANVKKTARAIAQLLETHQVVICHGNGPQVGLLALQNEAYDKVKPYPLDVLDAETQGMIGYLIQQEVSNASSGTEIVTLLTQVVVDQDDPAFKNPTKPIGPVFNKTEADEIAKTRAWTMAPDGEYFRRVVPSPQPQDIVELQTIRKLITAGVTVICGGGGGIPVLRTVDNQLTGVEAVIDKDLTAALIAEKLRADMLLILTDVKAVCMNFGTTNEACIHTASPAMLQHMDFPPGSMAPKIAAACQFVENTHKKAAIGALTDVTDIVEGLAGTQITFEGDKA